MTRVVDITGSRFGRLLALERRSKTSGGRARVFWLCLCECGRVVSVNGDSLRYGRTESCGQHRGYEPGTVCRIEGCDRRPYGNGLCRSHWKKERRTQNPSAIRAKERAAHGRNRDRNNLRHRASYRKHRQSRLSYAKLYSFKRRSERPDLIRSIKAREYVRNRQRIRAKQNAKTAALSDGYVRFLLGIPTKAEIPPVLLEAKRAQLQLYRLAKDKK